MLLGENADAARLFTSLASSRCYTDASRFYLGYIAFAEKRYDDALKLFESVDRTTSPGNCADYYLAEIYFTKSDYNKALSLAQK